MGLIRIKLSSHKTPVFKEEKSKDWVIYGAEKGDYYNNYPAYLMNLYNRSSKQNAFINGKVHYICGNGVEFDTTNLSIADKAVAAEFLKKKNKHGDTLKDIVKKAVLDTRLFGGFYLEIIRDNSGKGFEIFHMPWNSLREDKEEGFWYSKDWSNKKQTKEDTGLEWVADFNPDEKDKRSIYAFKSYRPDLTIYPLPDYVASCVYAEIDIELSNYRLNALKSGFNAGTIISFNNGVPLEEDQEKIEKKIKEKFEGTDRANSLLLSFSRSKDSSPSIEHLTPQNVDEQLNSLNEQTTQELIIGHRITNPILVGVKTSGELGGSKETIESFELLKSNYIVPCQKEIEEPFNYLLELKGFANRLKLKEVRPMDEQLPIEEKIKVMDKNEIREAFGLKPLEIIEDVKPVISSTVHRFGDNDCCSHEFSSDEEDEIENSIEVFRQYGEDFSGYEVVSKKYIFNTVDSDLIFEDEIKNYSFDILEGDVKLLYRNIIDLLTKDPLLPNENISKALNVPLNRVSVAINRLISDGALTLGEKKSGDDTNQTRTPTKDALKVLDNQGSEVGKLRIMYSYEPRPGMRGLLDTSRPFCVKLIKAGKLFSRPQIEQISNAVGWDVWSRRGGFYTKKGTNFTTPFCRHIWVQNVVRKK